MCGIKYLGKLYNFFKLGVSILQQHRDAALCKVDLFKLLYSDLQYNNYRIPEFQVTKKLNSGESSNYHQIQKPIFQKQ